MTAENVRRQKRTKVTPEYKAWASMKSRCSNPGEPKFYLYGGRGVVVCRRWRRSFASFFKDVGPRPSPELSIDRFPDKHGNYSCGKCRECKANGWSFNVRWATRKQQQNNTRSNRLLTYGGKTLTVAEWSERTGIGRSAIWNRLARGWSVDKVLTTPSHEARIKFRGLCLSAAEWGRRTGISESRIRQRLRRGWTAARALTTPVKVKRHKRQKGR